MTAISNPDKSQILANINKLRESTTPPTDPHSAAPAPMPGHFSPQPTTFRKGGIVDKATEVTLTDADKDLTDFLDGIPMMDALKAWGKPQKTYRSVGPQSVLIRCPKPEHPDNNPSASCDLVEGVYRCHACAEGGDRYTMAALHHGFNMATHQDGRNFRELKKKMALDLGYTITESAGTTTLKAPTPKPPANPAPASDLIHLEDGNWLDPATGELVNPPAPQPVELPTPQPVELTGGVFSAEPQLAPQPVDFSELIEEETVAHVAPSLDWVPLGRNRSFIDTYMKYVSEMSYPDEYGFAAALLCLGFIGERRVNLVNEEPTHGNLGIITVGGTGIGKTRAVRHAQDFLNEVVPWKGAELALGTGGQIVPGTGVKDIVGAASGENLIRQFEDVVKVPNGTSADGTPHYEEVWMPVNGLIVFEEYETFIGKASATGSTLRQRLMGFMDGSSKIENTTNTQGNSKAVSPFASLYTSIQPAVVHRIMNEHDEQTGFLNRVVFVTGQPKASTYYRKTPVDKAPVIKALREVRDYWQAVTDPVLDLTPDAEDKAREHLSTVIEPLKRSGQGIFGRLDVTFHKAMVLICVNEMTTTVTPDIVAKAIHLTNYFIETYRYVNRELYDPSTNPSVDTLDDRILKRVHEVVKKKKDKGAEAIEEYAATRTDIRRSVARHINRPGATPSQVLNRALSALVEAGELVAVNIARGTAYYIP